MKLIDCLLNGKSVCATSRHLWLAAHCDNQGATVVIFTQPNRFAERIQQFADHYDFSMNSEIYAQNKIRYILRADFSPREYNIHRRCCCLAIRKLINNLKLKYQPAQKEVLA